MIVFRPALSYQISSLNSREIFIRINIEVVRNNFIHCNMPAAAKPQRSDFARCRRVSFNRGTVYHHEGESVR